MKLVTQTEVACTRLGDKKGIEVLCKAGYDGLDFSMFSLKNDDDILASSEYKTHVKNLKEIATGYGVTFEQSHAPFPSAKEKDKEYSKMIMERLKRSIEIAGILDAKIIVVHPVFYKKHKFEQNMELYHTLEPYARDYGVKIALENMWGRGFRKKIKPNVCSIASEFNEYVDALDKNYFTACLDLGHCGLVGDDAGNMIRQMNSRLGCLHINDNDFVHDSHTLPYTMDMDWDDILDALAEVNYQGNFTYEADNFIKKFPKELIPDACEFMVKVGRNMIKQIDYKKEKNG